MDTKKILIAETSSEFSGQLCDCLKDRYTLRVCHSGLTVKEQLEEFRPDVLVMDLALPGLDGISLLRQLEQQPHRPRILLTTCFMSSYVEAAIAKVGVDMVMRKPCDITAMLDRILDLMAEEEPQNLLTLRHCFSVTSMLMDLNIPSKRRGFGYLEMCIELYVEQPGQALTKTVYPKVAKENHTKGAAVERAIRQVIHESWEKRDNQIWKLYFCSGRDGVIPRPTNAEFISRLAEQYRQERKKQA